MAVSNHQLLFQPFSQTLNLSKGEKIHITDLKRKLFLDGSPIQDQQIEALSAKLPSWLKLDNNTAEVSGDAPPGTMSQDLVITAKDQYGDVAQFSIHLAFRSDLFDAEIGQLNATIGESFEFAIPPAILAQKDEKLGLDFASLSKYLHFDPATSTISGTIQQDIRPQKVQCTLTASSSDGTMQDLQTFQISVSAPAATAPVGTKVDTHQENSNGRTAGIIIGSILGAISGVLLLVTLVICLRRRKRSRSYISPKLPRSPRKSDISRPMFIPYGWPDVIMEQEEDLEKGKEDHELPVNRTPEYPPNLDDVDVPNADLPLGRRRRHSLTESIGDSGTMILDNVDESSFVIQNDAAPSQHPHDSMVSGVCRNCV